MDESRETAQALTHVRQGAHKHSTAQSLDWSGVLARQGYVLGVDISGDGERVVLCDLHGKVVGREVHSDNRGTPQPPKQVMPRLISTIQRLLDTNGVKPREVLRIGAGFGGPVDAGLGTARLAHDCAGWEDYPIAAQLEARFDVPSMLDNDARLAALGEMWFGAGNADPECDLVYLHWSTGIGGGIVSGGRLLRGVTTTAGEIGHTTVRTGGDLLPCRCGGTGHLEAYLRAPALLTRARALDDSDLKDVADLLSNAERSPRLQQLVDEAVEMMAVTVGNLITFLNPSLVVIGGRVAREGSSLIPLIAKLARTYALPISAQDVKIVPASLGEDSTMMGAVALALESLR